MLHNQSNIAFLINSLEGGGAEGVMCKLLTIMENDFTKMNIKITLVLLDDIEEAYECPTYVNKIVLNSKGSLIKGYSQLHSLFSTYTPDTCFSFLTRANMLNTLLGKQLGYRTVISERVNTSSHLNGGIKNAITKRLIKLTYPRADKVVAVSNGVKVDLINHYDVHCEKIDVIYNPYDVQQAQALALCYVDDLPRRPYMIGTGRLVKNKNFSLLLQAFAEADTSLDLLILGQGDQESELRSLAVELGIEGRVHLKGYKSNPYPYLKRAEFFVSTSNAEGFPNAIVEAMCLGKPVIATNCESGPAEILTGQYPYSVEGFCAAEYGCICEMESVTGVTAAMNYLSIEANREHYAAKSTARSHVFSCNSFREKIISALNSQQTDGETFNVSVG